MNAEDPDRSSLRPSVSEFHGAFNIGDEQPSDGIEYLETKDGLPPLRSIEANNVLRQLHSFFVSLNAGVSVPLLDCDAEKHCEFLAIKTSDRPVALEWRNPSCVTAELVQGLQAFLAQKRPRWRFILFGCEPKASIAIYPDAVVFEATVRKSTDAIFTSQLARAMQLEAEYVDSTEGKRERQLSSVQQHISLLAPFIAYKRGPVIIRHYDEWKGDHADHTLWMLTLGSTKPRQWLVVDEQIGYGMGFEVDQDGEFLEHYSESPNVVGHVYEIIGPESRFRQNSISVRNTDNNEIHDIALPSASHQN